MDTSSRPSGTELSLMFHFASTTAHPDERSLCVYCTAGTSFPWARRHRPQPRLPLEPLDALSLSRHLDARPKGEATCMCQFCTAGVSVHVGTPRLLVLPFHDVKFAEAAQRMIPGFA